MTSVHRSEVKTRVCFCRSRTWENLDAWLRFNYFFLVENCVNSLQKSTETVKIGWATSMVVSVKCRWPKSSLNIVRIPTSTQRCLHLPSRPSHFIESGHSQRCQEGECDSWWQDMCFLLFCSLPTEAFWSNRTENEIIRKFREIFKNMAVCTIDVIFRNIRKLIKISKALGILPHILQSTFLGLYLHTHIYYSFMVCSFYLLIYR